MFRFFTTYKWRLIGKFIYDYNIIWSKMTSKKTKSSANVIVPCIRVIVEDWQNRILLLKRDNCKHGVGGWCLPGGKVDYGQTLVQACIDELQQETGLVPIDCKFLFYQDSLPLKKGSMHCLNHYFLVEARGQVVLNDESSEFKWVFPDEICKYELVFRNDEGIERFLSEKEDDLS